MNDVHKRSLILSKVRKMWAEGHPDIEKYDDMEEHIAAIALQESSCNCHHIVSRDKKIHTLENMLMHLQKDNSRLKRLHDEFTKHNRQWDIIRKDHPDIYKQCIFIWTGKTYEQIIEEKKARKQAKEMSRNDKKVTDIVC